MHVAAIQFDIRWEDKPANHALIEQLIVEAKVPAGAFVLTPELGDTGFSFNLDDIVDERSLEWAIKTARRLGVWMQHGFAARGEPDGLGLNRTVIVSPDGDVVGQYDKIHPFTFGREAEHYQGGREVVVRRLDGINGAPLISPFICYDLRFPEIWRVASQAGAEVFTIGASWPAARQEHWRALLIARAIENQAYVVAVNRVGSDPHLAYGGGSMIISPNGAILAEANDRPAVLQARLDLDELRSWRESFPALRDARSIQIESISIDPTI